MKKLIVSAFCLALTLTSVKATALTTNLSANTSITVSEDDRQVVKPEELPESIKKTLAGDAYKGWAVKEAVLVNNAAASADNVTAADGTKASYYEVTLTKEKESKTFKFNNDGTVVK